jgi:CubicO group peptidase (beta-lactamase class C family)
MRDSRPFRQALITAGLALTWTLIVISAVVVEAFWFAAPPVTRGDIKSLDSYLSQKLNAAAANKKLGSAALVLMRGGEISAEHGFGVADFEKQDTVAVDSTLYPLASVSKAVTAWGVMHLVEEGKLGLDEPVMRHLTRWRFPGMETDFGKITVRQLLSHTSGIEDDPTLTGSIPLQQNQRDSGADAVLEQLRGVRVAAEPGTRFIYSSQGYIVLQLLIEEVTQQPFSDYMHDTVLQPLGMVTASFDQGAIIAAGRGGDLAASFDKEVAPQAVRRYAAVAGVSLHATPRDLAQFMRAFVRPDPVLRPETLQQMLQPQPATLSGWGLGHTLFVTAERGGLVIGHDGGASPAWGALFRVNPVSGNGMALVVSGGRGAVNRLGHDWVYWETGKITAQARRQIAYDRALPASLAILIGAMLIVLWRSIRSPRALA